FEYVQIIMSRPYLPIHQIIDETNNWTALIQVVERPSVQTSKNNASMLYRRYLFKDEEGIKVYAVAYIVVIDEFGELLMSYKRYYLSGAKVRPEVPLYQFPELMSKNTKSPCLHNFHATLISTPLQTYTSIQTQTTPKVKTCWIREKIKFIQDNRPLWTTTCYICRKNYNMLPNTPMKCRIFREDSHVEARCRLPIAVEDQTGTLNVVIYGAYAERLITYSGNELYEADQQGCDLTKEIAASVARHKVVCFVKQSESAYHTIVKFYTVEMMMVQSNTSTGESSGKQISTTTPSKDNNPNLFNPTLKNVLESVAMKIEQSPNKPRPKKQINFDTQQRTAETGSSTTTQSSSQSAIQPPQNPATNPSIKIRPKMDENLCTR
ncbi:CW-type Zinc Finger, partial [Striga asiatica]